METKLPPLPWPDPDVDLKTPAPPDGTKPFKYQILVDHLKLEEARMITDAYLNSPAPFTDTVAVLT